MIQVTNKQTSASEPSKQLKIMRRIELKSSRKPIKESNSKVDPNLESSSELLTDSQTKRQYENIDSGRLQTNMSSSSINQFVALQQLKKTDDHLQMMKRRLSVLKVKEEKNNLRYLTNVKKMSHHNSVQEITQQEKDRIQIWKENNQEKIKEMSNMNFEERILHHNKMEQLKRTNKEEKEGFFIKSKEFSKSNEKRIQDICEKDLKEKKQVKHKIKMMEENTKKTVEQFNLRKQIELKQKKWKETDKLELEKIKKEQQIKKVTEMQMEMIQRQSNSRMICENSQNILKTVLNPEIKVRNKIKSLKGSNKTSPISIDQKSFSKEKDNFLSRNGSFERHQLNTGLSSSTAEKDKETSSKDSSVPHLPHVNSIKRYSEINSGKKGFFFFNS